MQSPSFVIAPDSFKESLRADLVSNAINTGLSKTWSDEVQTIHCPMADGGEGLVDVILTMPGAEEQMCKVSDPLNREVTAKYAVLESEKTIFVEMAQASGLERVAPDERNPETATSRGTGELLERALWTNLASRCIVGIGGSATNDAGIGMAHMLDFRFFDSDGEFFVPLPGRRVDEQLKKIHRIVGKRPGCLPPDTEILVACDVENPLCGPNGATMTYAAQKGASPEQIDRLEAGMQHFADVLDEFAGESVSTMPGSGAAGGLGAALVAFCGAKLQPGFNLIADIHNLDEAVQKADLVITGEGRMDKQTLHGKVPAGVAKNARRYNKPCVAFCGDVADREALEELGFFGIYSIMDIAKDRDDAMQNAAHYLEELAATFARDWKRVIDSGS